MGGRFVRLGETGREKVKLRINGADVEALAGDTLLVAMLCTVDHVRQSEFGDETRAGFCLMGACQDCWVWTETGERLRACTTEVREGMQIVTTQPEVQWANLV
ncbi:(2Fe-2S)-binding protein [Paraburkholderia sp. A1RI_3L]|jgi:predicted molibdopterin-dependent oxidoreductase YjgC|uniref:(2Fe-2S)-binding protein n=1 Tax=Paraburkholderia TaxID=1822464 RepID=UPI000346D6F5|nr:MULTISPECIES: (2Fe-2S)-binding protein [Paraburkholderia]WEY42519.1 (2Fe-2S)-binding protein [Paraburkholderia sp. SUR17]